MKHTMDDKTGFEASDAEIGLEMKFEFSRSKWIEGEPTECDGSAWDKLPPAIKAKELA